MKINNLDLTTLNRPFLIAEAGSSHGGCKDTALKMVKIAAEAKADAITFQEIFEEKLYTSLETLPVAAQPRIGWEALKECADLARSYGLSFSVCVTDIASLEEALSLPIDFIKIVSYDITFIPFLKTCGKKNIPILLSTGASTFEEIEIAIKAIDNIDNLLLYHTDCGYPTKTDEVNLKRMIEIKNKFKIPVGYCDHTASSKSCIASAVLGASIIEKHFILNRETKFVDYEVALEPNELINLFANIKETVKLIGIGDSKIQKGDEYRRNNLRRSIALNCSLEINSVIEEKHLTMLRPPIGLSWDEKHLILGKKTKKALKERQIITEDLVY